MLSRYARSALVCARFSLRAAFSLFSVSSRSVCSVACRSFGAERTAFKPVGVTLGRYWPSNDSCSPPMVTGCACTQFRQDRRLFAKKVGSHWPRRSAPNSCSTRPSSPWFAVPVR